MSSNKAFVLSLFPEAVCKSCVTYEGATVWTAWQRPLPTDGEPQGMLSACENTPAKSWSVAADRIRNNYWGAGILTQVEDSAEES
jgi:hypothetical protein